MRLKLSMTHRTFDGARRGKGAGFSDEIETGSLNG